MTFVIVWEFEARPEQVAAFERAYGSAGDWAVFFRQGSGYRGTELLRDQARPRTYLTIDRWDSADALGAFRRAHETEYHTIDARCAALTARERRLGEFETVE